MRECGGCNLCCKVIAVDALEKPAGVWCKHALPGQGCTIYGSHPDECKTFMCGWLTTPELGDEWKPSTARFAIRVTGKATYIHVDPSYPGAWKKPRYYSALKKRSEAMWTNSGQIIVYDLDGVTVLFPEEDIAIGSITPGDVLHAGYRASPLTRQPYVRVVPKGGAERERRGAIYPNR